jgi:hypothetical protein
VARNFFVAPRPNAASRIDAQAPAAVARKSEAKRLPSAAADGRGSVEKAESARREEYEGDHRVGYYFRSSPVLGDATSTVSPAGAIGIKNWRAISCGRRNQGKVTQKPSS